MGRAGRTMPGETEEKALVCPSINTKSDAKLVESPAGSRSKNDKAAAASFTGTNRSVAVPVTRLTTDADDICLLAYL